MGGLYVLGGLVAQQLQTAKNIRRQGANQQNIAEFNAQVAERQAEAERQRAAFAQKRQAKRGAEVRSELTARLGPGLGSPVAADLAAEQAAEIELENLMIGFEGEVLARRAETQAELDRLQGEFAKQKGKAAARAANIQFGMQVGSLALSAGGGSFLTGFGGKAASTGGRGTIPWSGYKPKPRRTTFGGL